MGDLQLGSLAGDNGPVLAPIELKRFPRLEDQRHECSSTAGLLLALSVGLPATNKGGDAAIGAVIAERDKVGVQALRCPLLLARFDCFLPQPTRQLLGEWVQFAWPIGNLELWLHRVRPQVFADRVPGQSRPPLDLPDRDVLPEMPAPDYAQ
jgi:hypothetical protein